jgi:hypothetical protein
MDKEMKNCTLKQFLHVSGGIESWVCLILSSTVHYVFFLKFLTDNNAEINEFPNFITNEVKQHTHLFTFDSLLLRSI